MTGQRTLRRGFTLIEMVAVVAIIGILIAIVIGGVAGHVSRASVTSTRAQIKVLATNVETFFIQQKFDLFLVLGLIFPFPKMTFYSLLLLRVKREKSWKL